MNHDLGRKQQCFRLSHQESGHFDLTEALKQLDGEAIALESADVITKLGEKSLLLLDLVLKIEARNNHVCMTALLDEGVPLLSDIAHHFSSELIEHEPKRLSIHIKSLSEEQDLIKKLSSPSLLDVLRYVLKNLEPRGEKDLSTLMLAGVFAYDFLDHFEKLPEAKKDELKLPDFLFYLPLSV